MNTEIQIILLCITAPGSTASSVLGAHKPTHKNELDP